MLSESFIFDCMEVMVEKFKEYKSKGISEDKAFALADQYVMDVFFKDIDYDKELAELIAKCKEIEAEIFSKCKDERIKKDFDEISNAFKVVLNLFGDFPASPDKKATKTTSSWGGMVIEKTDNTFVCHRND